MRTIFEHQKKVAIEMTGLSTVQSALFICAVCQRQLPVYEEFSEGKPWDNRAELRALMNDCWNWAVSLGRTIKPSEPIPNEFIDTAFDQSSSGLAVEAFSSVEHLVYLIISEQSAEAASPVEYAFTILDSYVYKLRGLLPVSKENDKLVDADRLVIQEMGRQNEQLAKIARAHWQCEDWNEFRREVETQSLLQ